MKNDHRRSCDLSKVVIKNCVNILYYIVPDNWYSSEDGAPVKF